MSPTSAPAETAFAPPPDGAVRCLKAAGIRSVWLVEREGVRRVAKAWPLTPYTAVSFAVGRAQAQRHRRGAALLTEAGIHSPRVTRCAVGRRGGRRAIELETEYVEGATAFERLRTGELTPGDASALGALVARFASARLFNRDLKLSNVIVRDDGGLAVIDPVGVRRGRDGAEALAERARMIERLAIEPLDQGIPIPFAITRAALRGSLEGLDRPTRRKALAELRRLVRDRAAT